MSEEKDRVDGTADETKAETKSSDHHTEDTYEKVCFMCRRPESKAGKMITLPGNINICPDCMQKSFDTMNQNPGQINEMMNNMNNMPNIGMFDLSGLSNQIPNRQRVKKKEEKKKTKEFSIKDIPPPHRIKAMLDEYVIGQESYVGCRLQPLQTCLCAAGRKYRDRKIQHADDRTDRFRKNVSGADTGTPLRCAACHHGRHIPYRSGLYRR